jgi:hypothetical protein
VIAVTEGAVGRVSGQANTAGTLAGPGAAAAQRPVPDVRRVLQLGLAAVWLLDGVLQYQSFMFSHGFTAMLASTAAGNPAVIAHPITWAAGIIAHHPAGTNAAFATIQVLLGLGIACRLTVRPALAASVVWSAAVWWLGEGLGGVLNGTASPVNGAPGAVILYGLLAVLLWPAASGGGSSAPLYGAERCPTPASGAERCPALASGAERCPAPSSGAERCSAPASGAERCPAPSSGAERCSAPFVAARPVGARTARALWLVLWGSLAYFAVTAANRSAQGLHDMVAAMAAGEPGWLASVNRGGASLLAHRGLAASVVLAALLAVIAVGVFAPVPTARAALVLAIVVALVIWVVGQDLGGILAGGATDVNSGPLLVLLALAYWPSRAPARTGAEAVA